MSTTVTVDAGQGQTLATLSGNSVVPDATVSVDLTNPCDAATIDTITFSPSSLEVAAEETIEATFSIPSDSIDSTHGGTDICGDKQYTVYVDSVEESTWITIAASSSVSR